MGVQLTLFTKDYVQSQLLPPWMNGDYSLLLEKEKLGLFRSCVIRLEVLRGNWRIYPSETYQVFFDRKPLKEAVELLLGEPFGLRLQDGTELSLIARQVEHSIRAFHKLVLTRDKEIRIGRRADCEIFCKGQKQVSGVHGVMRYTQGSWCIQSYSGNGLYINGKLSRGESRLAFDDRIQIADITLVFLGSVLAVDSAPENIEFRLSGWEGISCNAAKKKRDTDAPGKIDFSRRQEFPAETTYYHRSPRAIQILKFDPVEMEAPPGEMQPEMRPLWMIIGPPLTMALPMVLGFGLMRAAFGGRSGAYLYAGLFMSVTAALGSVFWAVMNQKRSLRAASNRSSYRKKMYLNYLSRKEQELRQMGEQYRHNQEYLYPEPGEGFKALEQGCLWERTPDHPDFMKYRFGVGEKAFPGEIRIPKDRFLMEMDELSEYPARIRKKMFHMSEMPILWDLSREGLIGIVRDSSCGSPVETAALLAAQVAVRNCYTELKLAVIFDETREEQQHLWEFAKWLPHIWSVDHQDRYFASNKEEAAEVLAHLSEIVRGRRALLKEKVSSCFLPRILLFISEEEIAKQRDFQHLFQPESWKTGLTVCVLSEDVRRLPHNCRTIIEKSRIRSEIYETAASERGRQKLIFDRVDPKCLEGFARSISGIRVSEQRGKGEIPARISFLELHHVRKPEELHVEEHWLKNRTYENIRGELGMKAGGKCLCLDLHEKYHGPHGLLAGTTGSGKSETLLTFLLSLAVNYSPEELAFFLIDYKGGGMASMLEGLPHLAGSISNLSGNQIFRALVSIQSENRKRQRMFLEYEVNHIDAYTRLYQNKEARIPVPHLLIVVDEFAELKKAEPEFMRELISVAQVGRSLGVHLILATQKPAGVVDDHIRSNAHFRICLRVQDRQDSMDLLHKPDAANLTQIGRGYIQVGNDELYEEFQSGYSGAAYDPEQKDRERDRVLLLTHTGNRCGIGRQKKTPEASSELTELQAVKEHLKKTFELMQMQKLPSLWMQELPEILALSDCEPQEREQIQETMMVPLGMIDDPEEQAQPTMYFSLPECGHTVILGISGSGKSTFLQTMLWKILSSYSPDQVQLLVFDFSDGGLTAFSCMPHVIGILTEQEEEENRRALFQIDKRMEDRRRERAAVSSSGKSFRKDPLILVVIDNYGKFREKMGETCEYILYRIAREGSSLDILLAVTGGGFSMTEIPGRFSNLFQTVICLALPDKFAYRDALRNMRIDRIPEQGIPGRGMVLRENRALEFQTALAIRETDSVFRRELLEKQCENMNACFKGSRAVPLSRIPADPVWKKFSGCPGEEAPWRIPVGYEDATGDFYSLDFRKEYCFLINGEMHSGRKNFLKILLLQMRQRKAKIVLLDPTGTFFYGKTVPTDILHLQKEEEWFEFFKDTLIPLVQKRSKYRQELLRQGYPEEKIQELFWKEPPCFIGISDFGMFLEKIYHAEKDMKGFLENLLEKGEGLHIYFAAVLASEQKEKVNGIPSWKYFVRKKRGIHFGGALQKDTALCFDDISYGQQTKLMDAGWGILSQTQTEKKTRKLRIPLVGWEDL